MKNYSPSLSDNPEDLAADFESDFASFSTLETIEIFFLALVTAV